MSPAKQHAVEKAHVKYALILPLIHGTFPQETKIKYCEDVAKNPITFPDGKTKMVKPRTILDWYYKYIDGGFEALYTKTRADKGESRKLSEAAVQEITQILTKTPKISCVKINEQLQGGNKLDGPVSDDVIQRYVKNHAMRAAVCAEEADDKERTAFEAEHFGELWQADSLYGPYILDEDGILRRSYCIQILDDYTRYIVAGAFFFADNAVNFQQVFYDAIRRFGAPRKLLIDNGKSFKNNQVIRICGELEINPIPCPPYTPQWKGKIERVNRSTRDQFLNTINPHDIKSLEHINLMYNSFLDTYHNRKHSAIGTTPAKRLQESLDKRTSLTNRPDPDASDEEVEKWIQHLNFSFKNCTERRVRNDNTIVIDKVYYDIPPELHLAGQKIEVRFSPIDINEGFYMVYNNNEVQIYPTDKVKNYKTSKHKGKGKGKGKNGFPELDFSKIPAD